MEALRNSHNAPGISHLLFADDALLFFKADMGQAERIKQVLEVFQMGTSQLISSAKCSIMVRDLLDVLAQEQVR